MSRYLLLVILNAPFIIYGLMKATIYFKDGIYNITQLLIRVAFWLGCLGLIVFAKPVYDLLVRKHLTDSPPLSLAEVFLTTACFLSLTLIVRLFARQERMEKKLTELVEELALRDIKPF